MNIFKVGDKVQLNKVGRPQHCAEVRTKIGIVKRLVDEDDRFIAIDWVKTRYNDDYVLIDHLEFAIPKPVRPLPEWF